MITSLALAAGLTILVSIRPANVHNRSTHMSTRKLPRKKPVGQSTRKLPRKKKR